MKSFSLAILGDDIEIKFSEVESQVFHEDRFSWTQKDNLLYLMPIDRKEANIIKDFIGKFCSVPEWDWQQYWKDKTKLYIAMVTKIAKLKKIQILYPAINRLNIFSCQFIDRVLEKPNFDLIEIYHQHLEKRPLIPSMFQMSKKSSR